MTQFKLQVTPMLPTWSHLWPSVLTLCVCIVTLVEEIGAETVSSLLHLSARSRVLSSKDPNTFLVQKSQLHWQPKETALLICDMRDSHYGFSAFNRIRELAPHMNKVVKAARDLGVLIIHVPSDCMEAYSDHIGRKLAQSAPTCSFPASINKGCCKIAAKAKKVKVPELAARECEDEVEKQVAWRESLKVDGRNPNVPWQRQIDALEIKDNDAISDSLAEIWNLLEYRSIKNLIILGQFNNVSSLRLLQFAESGKRVVLMRDMTDSLIDLAHVPDVSQFTNTDYLIEEIETFVCPTITSDQIFGGKPFRFSNDKRKHVVLVLADKEYETLRTVPSFSRQLLGRDFKVSTVTWAHQDSDDLVGIEMLNEADLALFSAWRRTPPHEQMEVIRKFIADGRPLVGIRQASHAFARRDGIVPPGHASWPDFDTDVLGAKYRMHHKNIGPAAPKTYVWTEPAVHHPISQGFPSEELNVPSWLYKFTSLGSNTTVLLLGRVEGRQPYEPVAWTNIHSGGGKVFYTSLGHPDEFEMPFFRRLLLNGVYWAAGLTVPERLPANVAATETPQSFFQNDTSTRR